MFFKTYFAALSVFIFSPPCFTDSADNKRCDVTGYVEDHSLDHQPQISPRFSKSCGLFYRHEQMKVIQTSLVLINEPTD